MSKYHFAVLPGDGIGEEVVREGLKVLAAAAGSFGFDYESRHYPFGADHYLETGETMPESVFTEFQDFDAIFMGAIGDPRVETGLLEHAIIGGTRFKLDLYINLRPVKLYSEHLCPLKDKKPADIDMVFVRENTEDAYTRLGGIFKQGTPDEVATATMIYTRKGCERAIRYAFEVARKRAKRKKLTLVDKANAIRAQDIWTRTFAEVAQEYPDIETNHAYIDAACMWMLKNPEWFDVAVTTNIFGDIITDLGAMLQGGLGIAASGNIHPGKVSMFEPIHGSAPKYRGKNVANPIAAIMAVAMMLDYVGEARAAGAIEQAVQENIVSRRIPSLDAGTLPTDRIGSMIAASVAAAR
ncbi:MAG: 3-isopropylmalate dehydrogenase [Planctomycetes bacterium]|nr:3-isopropylmalate dehydrogenase [Planctomycetota bacterium]